MTVEQLRILVSTIQQLSLARDISAITSIVRKSARALTGADGATFVLKDKGFCHYVDEDAISPLWKGQRFPLETCISGWAMLNKKNVMIEDIYVDDRIPIDAYRPTFVKSLVMVPIRIIDPIGAIGNYWAKQHTPTAEEIELLQSLADITSVSIENVYVYNELEERVKQRTAQLHLANKDLESFAHTVSHDLRAPLRAMNSYVETITEHFSEQLNNDAQSALQKIIVKVEKMDTLIQDLLNFSKLGERELLRENVDMNKLTAEVIEEINKSVKHTATITMHPLPSVYCDYNLIYRVLINLISNAVKYSSKKEQPVIEISAQTEDDLVTFMVKDNGAGFDDRYLSKLFGTFQRLHKESEFEGIGLGLALVQRIILKHGGNVWAEGKPNQGATFYFSLKKTP